MSKQIPQYLKLHTEDPALGGSRLRELSSVDMLCATFERATGWHLQYEPGPPDDISASGLILSPATRADDERFARVPRQEVEHLAASIALVLGELDQTRRALAEREAELAAGVPIAPRSDETAHLVDRLEASLMAGVEAVGAQAGALYLLDEATSQLKLRAVVGLPRSRLAMPARPLRGAIADLEALLGHAVVIEDVTLLPHWKCPEDFPAAMCVPVSSPSTPLGTLWIFSDTPRDFTAAQTNMIEVVAGRIAADLEREMLLSTGVQTKSLERELHVAAQWQAERLPTIAPLIDDWDVAGATQPAGRLASELFDWSVLSDGHLAVAVADAHGRELAAGLSSAALSAALRAHSAYRHEPRQMLERVNETLWAASPGGQFASLFYGQIVPETGILGFASAGRVGGLLLSSDGHLVLPNGGPPLGSDPDLFVVQREQLIKPGSALLVYSDGVVATTNAQGLPWDETTLAEFLRRWLHLSADELIARLQTALGVASEFERTMLVVKRVR